MSSALEQIAGILERQSGIKLAPAQFGALEAAIARVEPGLTAEKLLRRLSSSASSATGASAPQTSGSDETLLRLIDQVTIRETFFFRHPGELEAIDWPAMLHAARGRGAEQVRVWVAGCASGEEAYTIAILACEAFAMATPPVRVLASDIAPTAIKQAERGSYNERSARNLTPALRERYFTSAAGMITVSARLRGLVQLRSHNLVRDHVPPPGEQRFDLILCRNVLIYFDRATVERVIKALEGALAPEGLLLLGAADRLSGQGVMSGQSVIAPASRVKPRRKAPVAPVPVETPPRPAPTQSPSALQRALQAADRGRLDLALSATREALQVDPLNAEAYFIQGVAELAGEHAGAAVEPLRRALYIDPNHSPAAFNLARAHDALREHHAARRAYERTLRTLDHEGQTHSVASARLERVDIAAACHARLRELTR
jgi:chemotaxis methyl-accepting protein methylase